MQADVVYSSVATNTCTILGCWCAVTSKGKSSCVNLCMLFAKYNIKNEWPRSAVPKRFDHDANMYCVNISRPKSQTVYVNMKKIAIVRCLLALA